MSILIADSGSTKTSWVVLENDATLLEHTTDGLNPIHSNKAALCEKIRSELIPHLSSVAILQVDFYGAGCGNDFGTVVMKEALTECFPKSSIRVNSDLLAAARALFGSESGISCILGTGSHACVYNGNSIVREAVSLGYLLGDEGSGTQLGKQLLRDYFYGELPDPLARAFSLKYNLSREALLIEIYQKPTSKAFLASFVPFLAENRNEEYVQQLLYSSFQEFLYKHVIKLVDSENSTLGFVGSIAAIFEAELRESVNSLGFEIKHIYKNPIEGLLHYYRVHA